MGDKVFSHLLSMEKNKQIVIDSLLELIDQYFIWIKDSEHLTTGKT